ncbi:hypothetical protein [Bacillus sp. AFS017336]|uniref:hypothetical protein n=1 Tax=Bacillus sp. AFS017336 TaxID=2033489 RepID=UPI000BEFA4FC|nr:hypothetical protein [Bacillus sp. AFS017336]PEL14303.1 hypothetical protein CN601_01815 [Bacillus sp. AFS017336]
MANVDKTQRFNMYLSQTLVDGLDVLGDQINVPKNSLINVAIAKLLLDMKVVDNLDEANIEERKPVLKETEYCELLEQGRLVTKDQISTIEKIKVKSTGQNEIRFAYYKLNKNNNERLILRPLDLNETELLQLFIDAVNKEVFSSNFRNTLKGIL